MLSEDKISLYIHIPFCRRKCHYCDFVSYGLNNKKESFLKLVFPKYLNALKEELISKQNYLKDKTLNTIYIGGGTPGVLSDDTISDLFGLLYKFVKIDTDTTEITFECNPESITKEKLKILKRYYVNRLSIGVQSFNDQLLPQLGRVHNSKDAERKIKLARSEGFDNINIDLISGLPDSTIDELHNDIEKVLTFQPEHISVYALSVEKNTEFYRRGVITSDDLQRQMYEYTSQKLKSEGYIHYEISNFAREEIFECRHNLNYWKCGKYLGLGVGAASYIDGIRFKNTSSLKEYLASPDSCIVEREIIDTSLSISEKFFLGLRLLDEGVIINENDEKLYGKKISELIDEGFVTREGKRLRILPQYAFTSNYILSEFV